MSDDAEKRLSRMREAIEKVVEIQINTLDPPETRETLDRLVGQGVKRDEALKMIGYVVGVEFFQAIGNEGGYDQVRFIKRLSELPELPFPVPSDKTITP